MCSVDRTVRVWDVKTGTELQQFTGHQNEVWRVAFAPDGRRALSGDVACCDCWISRRRRQVRRFEGHEGFINTALFVSDGQMLVTGSDDDTIRFWNANTGDELYRISDQNDTILDMAISADGRRLLALAANNDLRLWRVDRSLDELTAWIAANRYTRELTDPERALYHVEAGGD